MLSEYYDPMYEYQIKHQHIAPEFSGTASEVRDYLIAHAQVVTEV